MAGPHRGNICSPKNISARLTFAKEHLYTPQHCRLKVLWTDCSGSIVRGGTTCSSNGVKKDCVGQCENIIPEATFWGHRDLMLLSLLRMTKFIKLSWKATVHQQNLSRSLVMQQDGDAKHRSKSTTRVILERRTFRLMEWPSQNPVLGPTEMLRNDLKGAVHTRHPENMCELKWFCKRKWV